MATPMITHKRQNTLLDVTQQPNGTSGHELKKSISSISSNRKFSVTDLETFDEDVEYDPEIFKYLSELIGDQKQVVPLTPSTSKLMKDLFVDTMDDINNTPNNNGYPNTFPNTITNINSHSYQNLQSMSNMNNMSNNINQNDDEDVIESLEQGTTLVCYNVIM